jgi:transcription initiation factor IIE alpha subunit
MDYICPYCKHEVSLTLDGWQLLDQCCPECGSDIHEEAQAEYLDELVDQYYNYEQGGG